MSRRTEPEWWTVQDVASFLGVSTKTVKNMDADGRLPAHHTVNDRGDRRFDPEAVRAYRVRLSSTEGDS